MADHEPSAPAPPLRGQQFTHLNFLRKQPDGSQARAIMKVTAVRCGEVFYTYADSPTNKGDWRMPLSTWVERYGTAGPGK
ncbi:hypothetical protein A7R75_24145 [Mycolicibacterium llatzerense]|nr:hypothetical protein [Mycolicibacterium llatzerense]